MMTEKWSWIEAAHGMRAQLLDMLGDTELGCTPGGQNMTLGALCREMGETEYAYIQSLTTFTQEWSYRQTDPAMERRVTQLTAWFATLDDQMQATLAALSAEDAMKTIDRGGYPASVDFQLDCYLQAVLIFLGKVSIYLKAMSIALPQSFQDYIG
jgi:hypothetical protein